VTDASVATPDHRQWHPILTYISDPAQQKKQGAAGLVVGALSALLALVGLALALTGVSWSGWLLFAAGVATAALWILIAANGRVVSTWQGDDLIELVVADEGVVVQGGLAVTWAEVAEIRYEWSSHRAATGHLTSAAAGGLAHAGLKAAGFDGVTKIFEIRLTDFRAVKARSVSKMQRLTMMDPMLGDPGYLHVGLGSRSDEQVLALLDVLSAQTQRHGIPLTRKNVR
jgi:hypothetical protein